MSPLVAFACAWCQRVKTGSGSWETIASRELNAPGVTHGICPECLDRETRALAASVVQLTAPER